MEREFRESDKSLGYFSGPLCYPWLCGSTLVSYTRDQYSTCMVRIFISTSMHPSRMRTARLLPLSPSMHCAGGGCLLPGGRLPLFPCEQNDRQV